MLRGLLHLQVLTLLSLTWLGCAANLSLDPAAANALSSYGRDYWGDRPGPQGFRTVLIDAGHGGRDNGAVSRHTAQREKDANLDLALRLRRELSRSFRVVMIRTDDRFIDLDDRVAFANRYPDAVLISLHFNAGPAARRGPESYYWRVDSYSLAVRCQRAMESVSPADHSRGLVRRRLRLTRNPQIPAVLLEGGYMTHPTESRLIASPQYRQQLATAIASAIRTQAAVGDSSTGTLPHPIYAPPSRATDRPGS
jgi:N-acetylmuramoyl-L-alanine amidase